MNRNHLFIALALMAAAVLSACAGGSALSADDQIATIVAATLQAGGAPTLSAEDQIATGVAATLQAQVAPTDGSIGAQSAFGDCANTGQISIAYVKDGNVWIWVQGGPHSQLTNNGDANDVRISQDGCRIALMRSVPNPAYDPNVEFPLQSTFNELWVVNSDGVGLRKMAGQEFFATLPAPAANTAYDLYKFGWQPGSHTLAFGTRTTFSGPGLAQNNDVYLVNADTAIGPGDIVTLLPMGQGGDFYFSPDGQQIAFTTSTNVSVVDADGGDLRSNLVSFPVVITYSEYLYYPPVHWSPDSNSFMLAIPPEDGLAPPVNGVYPETLLWYVPLDGTPAFEAGAVQTVWFVTKEVQFTPDIGRVAYIRQYGEPAANQYELVVALSNGSNESPTIQSPEITFGDWGPDNNQYIYFITEGGNLHMWLGNANSPNVTPISGLTPFAAANAEVVWVEGNSFVQMLLGNAGAELSLMETSGAGAVIDTFANPFVAFDVAN
ncbi:MAG: hypothetical protein WD751_10440 [Anaerolineales bacterium]